MKKEKPKRGRGRPRKVQPVKDEKKKTDYPEQPQASEEITPKGIISEDDLLKKAESIRATGEELPAEHQTEIEPGEQLENDLISSEINEPQAEGEQQPAAAAGEPVQGDAIAEMENRMLLAPLEMGMNLPEGLLILNGGDQALLAMVRPDDLEIKKSPEAYWTVLGLLNVSKFMNWFIYNLRKKRAAKKAAAEAEEKRQREAEAEEQPTRSNPQK